MTELPLITIVTPLAAGFLALVTPRRWRRFHEAISVLASAAAFVLAAFVFAKKPVIWSVAGIEGAVLRVDNLAAFVALFVGLFGLLITFYSAHFMKDHEAPNVYYAYILWTIGGSLGAAFSNNLILLLGFWGFLGMALYILISAGGRKSAQAAKKSFIIIGGSDAAMLFGIAAIWHLTHRLDMDAVSLSFDGGALVSAAFLCFIAAAFAKSGVIPLHSWIPDSGEVAPPPVMALLPASLDKLLGIYLLARLTMEMFKVVPHSAMSLFLMTIGAVTILAGVLLALVQHNLNKLLAYHAVSQVGYMVLGLGTALPLGIAGGLFHMVNNTIYKACLFLSGGSVEKAAGTADLDALKGLGRFMPITFVVFVIAALSISGVPPFNGFFSKWMIYQALVECGRAGDPFWVIWLVAAMFGSAFTLASFMKLIYAAFLAPRPTQRAEQGVPKEVSPFMWLPQVALSSLCVIFGVFAMQVPIRFFIAPSVAGPFVYDGTWNATLAAFLLLAGLAIGAVIGMRGRGVPARRNTVFVGGEVLEDMTGVRPTDFYNTIQDVPVLGALYSMEQKKHFDAYEIGSRVTFFFTDMLRWLHNGILPTYLIWCLIGMLALFYIFLR